jgi:hypothetical protein
MKKTLFAVILVILSSRAVALSGNQLMDFVRSSERVTQGRHDPNGPDSANAGFVNGFVAGVAFTLDDISMKVCLPSKGTVGQYKAVVTQYLKENPAQLHRGAEQLVREALERSFPCK